MEGAVAAELGSEGVPLLLPKHLLLPISEFSILLLLVLLSHSHFFSSHFCCYPPAPNPFPLLHLPLLHLWHCKSEEEKGSRRRRGTSNSTHPPLDLMFTAISPTPTSALAATSSHSPISAFTGTPPPSPPTSAPTATPVVLLLQ